MLFLSVMPAFAYYEFDDNLRLAYSRILNLHLEEGKKLLAKEHLEKPGNQRLAQ